MSHGAKPGVKFGRGPKICVPAATYGMGSCGDKEERHWHIFLASFSIHRFAIVIPDVDSRCTWNEV